MLNDVFPITDYSGKLILEFVDYSHRHAPKYSIEECKERDVNFSAPLRHSPPAQYRKRRVQRTGSIYRRFPAHDRKGTFIINGAERVIVSQLVRSPGRLFRYEARQERTKLYSAQIIPNRGAWLEYETDSNDVLWVASTAPAKFHLTVLLRALGLRHQRADTRIGGRGRVHPCNLAQGSRYHQARPGQQRSRERKGRPHRNLQAAPRPASLPLKRAQGPCSLRCFLTRSVMILPRVGRYKFNKKLLSARKPHSRTVAAEPIVHDDTGEMLAEAGQAHQPLSSGRSPSRTPASTKSG